MTTFATEVADTECFVDVTYYDPGRPMIITGWGFGDAEPPEPAEYDFRLVDEKGNILEWLEELMSDDDVERIEQEIEEAVQRDADDAKIDAAIDRLELY
jgi:hypothetical protein